MDNSASSNRSPLLFFVLVYALSIPFWVIDVIFPMHLPVDNLPVTDIGATFVPAIVASIITLKSISVDTERSAYTFLIEFLHLMAY